MSEQVFPDLDDGVFDAPWWEWWLARRFGKRVVQSEPNVWTGTGLTVVTHEWRGKMYCEVKDEPEG